MIDGINILCLVFFFKHTVFISKNCKNETGPDAAR